MTEEVNEYYEGFGNLINDCEGFGYKQSKNNKCNAAGFTETIYVDASCEDVMMFNGK